MGLGLKRLPKYLLTKINGYDMMKIIHGKNDMIFWAEQERFFSLSVLLKLETLFTLFLPVAQQSLRNRGMNMAKITMSSLPAQLTPEELAELEAAEKMPIIFDDDCPRMTDDMLKQFHKMHKITIKVSTGSMKKIKSSGPDYAKILSHLSVLALNDAEMIKNAYDLFG